MTLLSSLPFLLLGSTACLAASSRDKSHVECPSPCRDGFVCVNSFSSGPMCALDGYYPDMFFDPTPHVSIPLSTVTLPTGSHSKRFITWAAEQLGGLVMDHVFGLLVGAFDGQPSKAPDYALLAKESLKAIEKIVGKEIVNAFLTQDVAEASALLTSIGTDVPSYDPADPAPGYNIFSTLLDTRLTAAQSSIDQLAKDSYGFGVTPIYTLVSAAKIGLVSHPGPFLLHWPLQREPNRSWTHNAILL